MTAATFGSTWMDRTHWSGATPVLGTVTILSAPECQWEHIPNDLTAATLRDGEEGKNLKRFNSAEEFLAELYDDE